MFITPVVKQHLVSGQLALKVIVDDVKILTPNAMARFWRPNY